MKCGVGDYTANLVAGLMKIPDAVPGVLTSVAAANAQIVTDQIFPVMPGWGFSTLKRVVAIIKQFRPDIVHLQYPASFGKVFMPNFLPLFCKTFGIAMVQTWHEHPIYSQMINALSTDTLVVVDPCYPSAYRQPYRAMVCHKQLEYIPIGANIPRTNLSWEMKMRVKAGFGSEQCRLIVFWGFATSQKGVELLFQAADPATDRLVLMCELDPKDSYQASIIRFVESTEWRGKCFITGYMGDQAVASILASADAAVFPFVRGSTPRNGSVLAARLQGTFIVTTHAEFRGYNKTEHTFYVAPGDVVGIREAITTYSGISFDGVPAVATWDDIAIKHYDLYERIIKSQRDLNYG